MVNSSNKWLFQLLAINCLYLFITLGWTLLGFYKAPEDSNGYVLFVISVGLSIMFVFSIVAVVKNLISPQKKSLRVLKLADNYNRIIHSHLIQDYSALYVAREKVVLLIPFIASLVGIGVFVFLTFKLSLLLSFSFIFPETTPFYLRFLGVLYIFNFICMSIYMTGYFVTGEILQRMFGMAKRNILIDVVFNYFYAIPFLLILTFLWVFFVLVGPRKENESISLEIWPSLRSLSLYALFRGFQYYTYINLAKISFGDVGVNVLSKEARSLFIENKNQLLRIFVRAGAFFGLAIIIASAILGWNSVLGFLRFLESDNYLPVVTIFLFLLFLLALFSEQLAILFYYIKSYRPNCSFEKIGLNLDPGYIPKKAGSQ